MGAFVDALEAVEHRLADTAETVKVTPPDLQTRLPIIKVQRIGGTDDGVTDTARIVVTVHAATYREGNRLARLVRHRLRWGPTPAGVIDAVRTEVGPREVPSRDAEAVRCFEATYRVLVR